MSGKWLSLVFVTFWMASLTIPFAQDTTFGPSSKTAPESAKAESEYRTNIAHSGCLLTIDGSHKLAIGDRISFRIEEELDEPKSLLIADSGEIEIPNLGRFPAEKQSCRELAASIKTALERDYYIRATVIIALDALSKSLGKVYVVGPVRSPGPQDIPSDEVFTVSKAIIRAGGFSEFADKHRVRITRRPAASSSASRTFVVDLVQILDRGKTEFDLPLEPGDVVVVPDRVVRF